MRWGLRGLALLATFAGGALTASSRGGEPRGNAELGGLRLRLEQAVWLHEPTDHGDTASLPSLPGVPRPGQRRLAVELTAFNPRPLPLDFSSEELLLTEPSTGTVWRPLSGDSTSVSLKPAQGLSMTLSFDVPPTLAPLRLEWRRGQERSALLSTRRPPSPGVAGTGWPRRVDDLPPGNATPGEALFHGRLACAACHGQPEKPDSARLGPALGDFARVGATRVSGMSAAQYVYESLLDPNAVIAPQCPGPRPCARPSSMPSYGEVLSPREMADLIRYLVSPSSGE